MTTTTRYVALCLFVLEACAVKQAPRPTLAAQADHAARRRMYDDYKLTEQHNRTAPTWVRADGEHSYSALGDVFDAYPSTRELRHRAAVRNSVLMAIGAVGAGLVGGLSGYDGSEPSGRRLSTDAQIAMYGAGGALIGTCLFLAMLWPNPTAHLADTYNEALRRDLHVDLDAIGARRHIPAQRVLAVAPTLVYDGVRSGPGFGVLARF